MFWSELAQRDTRLYLVEEADGAICAYAGLCAYAPHEAYIQTMAVAPVHNAAGSARRCWSSCSTRRDAVAVHHRRPRGARRQRPRAQAAVRTTRLHARSRVRRGYYQPSGDGRGRHAQGAGAHEAHPSSSASRRRATRPASGIVRGGRAARRRTRVERRGARSVRRRGARGREPRASRGDGADGASRARRRPGLALARCRRDRRHGRPGPRRRVAGRRRGREGLRAVARQAVLRRQPSCGSCRGRPAGARRPARASASRCWCRVGTPRCCSFRTSSATVDVARRDGRRRGG